jgi:zinc/manganese transport system ATP-binding protein
MTTAPAVYLEGAGLRFGRRLLWDQLTVTVPQGEFLAVLGPNGSGKTSLLRSLLGLQSLTSGRVEVLGRPARRGNPFLGYVPQQRAFDVDLALRGRDLVALGLDGHRWGWSLPSRPAVRQVDDMLHAVDAQGYADAPIGRLSGGEQQRLRIAQALIGLPRILLCDEPLLSLDPNYQQAIVQLVSDWNHGRGTTVIFVTHDINPVLSAVDRVLLLAGGRWALGHPDTVLTSETLSQVYGVSVDVMRMRGRIVVMGADLGGHESLPEVPEAARR